MGHNWKTDTERDEPMESPEDRRVKDRRASTLLTYRGGGRRLVAFPPPPDSVKERRDLMALGRRKGASCDRRKPWTTR